MKFEQSVYNRIWDSSEGGSIVTTILNNPELIKANHTFWATRFIVDPNITPTDQEGEAVFKSRMREIESGVMMDMRAPLGDSVPVDKKGLSYYSAAIPDFIARGYVEKATERLYKENLFEQFGDQTLVANYVQNELQRMVDSANQTLSNMAGQLLSTGKILYKYGEGAKTGVLKAEIPEENFDTAGEKVWSDPSARILDQMVEKEKKYKDKWGIDIPFIWEMEKSLFDSIFLNNEQVIEWVRYTNIINNVPLPERLVLTEDMATTAIVKFAELSPIVLVQEKQKDVVTGMVKGWKTGNVVFRPAGYAGYVRHAANLDEIVYKRYGSTLNSRNFARTMNGLATVMNTTINNGNLQEWHTDLMMQAVPSLDEFLYHVIIDTTVADS